MRRLLEEPGVPAVCAYALRHRVPSFAFVVQEPDSPGALDMERVRALGVRPGPKCAELKRGNKVREDIEFATKAKIIDQAEVEWEMRGLQQLHAALVVDF